MSEAARTDDALGSPPGFTSEGTRFSFEAEREIDRLTADFSARLRTRAVEKGEKFDQVQSAHVQEAHGELVATKVDIVADFGMAVGLPFGLLIVGIVINDVVAYVTDGVALHPFSLFLAVTGGLIVGASLIVNSQRYGLKRLFRGGGNFNSATQATSGTAPANPS